VCFRFAQFGLKMQKYGLWNVSDLTLFATLILFALCQPSQYDLKNVDERFQIIFLIVWKL
jgi:hypothetical protein